MWPKDSWLLGGETDLQTPASKLLPTVWELLQRFHQGTLSQVEVFSQNVSPGSPMPAIKKLHPIKIKIKSIARKVERV